MEMSGRDLYSGKEKMCIVRGGGALPTVVGVDSELALFWLSHLVGPQGQLLLSGTL